VPTYYEAVRLDLRHAGSLTLALTFDLLSSKIYTLVTHAMGNVHPNFGFPALVCFRVRSPQARTDGPADPYRYKTR